MLAPNDTAAPLANSVVPTGSTETPLTVPSGEQTGAKINVDIDVTADKVADFVLDLNACQSVVKLGGSGRYNLKPVVTATARLSDAGMRVIGYVDPALAAATTTVSAQLNGQSIKSSPPDATGKFVLYPVPAGSYDIVVASQGRATAVLTGVPVTTTAITTINTALTPIAPPPSVMRTVSGFVTTTGSNAIPDATLRALQTSTVTQVTVGSARVDGSTGSYSLALPAAAPLKAAYVAGGTVAFLPNSAAAGQYTLEAAVPGKTAQSVPADVSATNALKSFTFAP